MSFPTVGAVICNRRNLFNLSIENLAELSSIDKQVLIDIERGPALPTQEQFSRLADLLLIGEQTKFFWLNVLRPANSETVALHTVASLIRYTREIKKKHLADVAAFVGVSVPRISDIELGREIPTPEEFEKICLFLGISGQNKEYYEWVYFDSAVDEAAKERKEYYDSFVSWY